MRTNYREIARLKRKGVSERQIARQLSISRNTVSMVMRAIISSGHTLNDVDNLNDNELKGIFQLAENRNITNYVVPNYENLAKELVKPGVTMQLLWEEYHDECRLSRKQGYQLTQFKKYFRDYLNNSGFTDIVKHKAGERIEVDWAGVKPRWQDPDTGEIIYGSLFVGVLPFSGYGYGEVFGDMKTTSWIKGHINMFEYFGGVSKLIVPDNLRTGITKNTKDEIIVNQNYHEMAEYYGTIVIPARIGKPRDKASVEGMVNQLTTNIVARMRNYQFFTMEEYNQQLLIELDKLNKKHFQKKEGSRHSMFQEVERDHLIKLPSIPYSVGIWRKAKVTTNSHISYGKCYYSVPYQHIGEEIDVKICDQEIEIYSKQQKIAYHKLVKDKVGVYSTNNSHMPTNSNAFGDWNSDRYLNWAKRKGPFIYQVVQRQFEGVKVEQQKYRTVHSILKLADVYGSQRLEAACQYALGFSSCPSYKNLKAILVNKQDINHKEKSLSSQSKSKFLRGAKYYE